MNELLLKLLLNEIFFFNNKKKILAVVIIFKHSSINRAIRSWSYAVASFENPDRQRLPWCTVSRSVHQIYRTVAEIATTTATEDVSDF